MNLATARPALVKEMASRLEEIEREGATGDRDDQYRLASTRALRVSRRSATR
jgi:hypothetical protein